MLKRLERQPMHLRRAFVGTLLLLSCNALLADDAQRSRFAEVFDSHWQQLAEGYPYFKLYKVDWQKAREEFRPRALAAENETEFTYVVIRMLALLPDSHNSYIPPVERWEKEGTPWSVPLIRTVSVEKRHFVIDWKEHPPAPPPARWKDQPHVYPEVISIEEVPLSPVVEILAAGPVGTTFTVELGWPGGERTNFEMRRPGKSNLPPPERNYQDKWLISGRVNDVGYLRVSTFSPKSCSLDTAKEMASALRKALRKLRGTRALILDVQNNGGGRVTASDPFLGHFLKQTARYRWGIEGERRVIGARKPRYKGKVVVLVNGRSASGAEWAAKILRDAKRATVIGGTTSGAEAAVKTSKAADGSVLTFSHLSITEPGVRSFQHVGVELDHEISLTVEALRELGHAKAVESVRRARFAKALEVLEQDPEQVEALLQLAGPAELARRR